MKRMPSPATVIASVALFVAVGGPAEAAKLLDGAKIKRGTVTSKQVKDRSLAVRDLSTGARRSLTRTPARSVGTAQLLEGSVGAAQLTPGSVTAAALTPDSVTGANIIDKQVGNADLADSAVTAGKIATGSVRKSEISAAAVGTSELANGAVTADKLADGAISAAKIPDLSIGTTKLTDGAVTTAKLAASAVTGAQVADGSLGAADFADARGTTSPTSTFGTLNAGDCATRVANAPNLRSGGSVLDDVLIVTPPFTFDPGLTVTAVPSTGAQIALNVCNQTASNIAVGAPIFRVLALDT